MIQQLPLEQYVGYLKTIEATQHYNTAKIPELDLNRIQEVFNYGRNEPQLRSEFEERVLFIPEYRGMGYQEKEGMLELPFNYVSHRQLWFGADVIIKTASTFVNFMRDNGIEKDIVIDTFEDIEAHHNDTHFLWLNSPIAVVEGGYDAYLATLTRKRRYQMQNPDLDLKVEVKHNGMLNDNEHQFIRDNLYKKWNETHYFESAYLQAIWGLVGEGTYHFIARDEFGVPCCIASIVNNRDSSFMFQNLIVNVDMQDDLRGIGKFMLTKIMQFIGNMTNARMIFEPTCKTNLFGEENFDVYKRMVVNKNVQRPIAYITTKKDDKISPPYFNGTEWECSEERIVMYDPV